MNINSIIIFKVKIILTGSYRVKNISIARSVARCARTSDGYTKADAPRRALSCVIRPISAQGRIKVQNDIGKVITGVQRLLS